MTSSPQVVSVAVEEAEDPVARFDAIVIGAGLAGLYQLRSLLQAGFTVRCFEEAAGVGGVWYWSRYPGCAFDSPSETYGYSFSEELIQEWDWTHYYSFQPDAERYLNFVADKFGLRSHIQLDSRVTAATWDDDAHLWEVELEDGGRARASILIGMVGQFSAGFTPQVEGAERFKGESYHPSRWPRQDPDLDGKRVAVIGTGATAIQLIPHVARVCRQLTVFQRTPNYALPADNGPVDPQVQQEWKANHAEIHRHVRQGFGIRVTPDPRNGRDVPAAERLALYERAWKRRGFEKFMVLFHDLLTDRELLAEYSEFLRGKIRDRVKDPALADKLVPKDHLFQAKRVPLESGYYETFERENVLLVDVRETPIVCLTENGIRTTDREHEFDVIIYATGFDTATGAFKRLDIRGVQGRSLGDVWEQSGVSAYLGFASSGFPNFFQHVMSGLCSAATICVEWLADWITACLQHMRENGYTRIEPAREAEAAWSERMAVIGSNAIFGDAQYSWYNGSNVPGKRRQLLLVPMPGPAWRDECYAVSANGYEGFDLRGGADRTDDDDTHLASAAAGRLV